MNKDECEQIGDGPTIKIEGCSFVNYVTIDEAELTALRAQVAELREALEAVKWWASQRCPCENDEPGICPVCDADVSKDRCLAVDASFPRRVREKMEAALEMSGGVK